jgi:isoleucyl-tRNA synthetase
VTDEKGFKMAKRGGNAIDPETACNTHGADVLRYWVASVDYTNDVPCSDALLRQFGENYRNVRNTLRYLLGNLSGFDPSKAIAEMMPLDEWVVEQTDLLVSDCEDAYKRFDFGAVVNSLHNFCREELSKFYLDVVKDRMYCEASDSYERRSGQTASYHVLTKLVKLIAPILAHTAEETWTKIHQVLGLGAPITIHAETFDGPSEDRLQEIEASPLQVRFSVFRSVRDDVLSAFERFKGTDDVKNAQQVILKISEEDDRLEVLQSFKTDELATMLMVSWVELSEGPSLIEFRKSEFAECKRSRLRRPDVRVVEIDGEEVPLTARDRQVLGVS